MGTEASTPVIPPIFENVPEQLTERPQWVCWRIIEREGQKLTKIPFIPGTERQASTTDLMTWRTFSQALAAYEAGEPSYDGIGFCFCSADPYVAVDLDHCRDPETGAIEPWAQKIINSLSETYVEASPTGTGVHIIACGVLKEGVKSKHVEVYGEDRFLTFTGVVL